MQTLGSFVPSRANFAPGREDDKGEVEDPTVESRWFDPSAYTVPAAGFQGRAGRNTLIGPMFRRTDLSLTKRFPIGRAAVIEFRADIYNLLNNVNYGQPGGEHLQHERGHHHDRRGRAQHSAGVADDLVAPSIVLSSTRRHAGGKTPVCRSLL